MSENNQKIKSGKMKVWQIILSIIIISSAIVGFMSNDKNVASVPTSSNATVENNDANSLKNSNTNSISSNTNSINSNTSGNNTAIVPSKNSYSTNSSTSNSSNSSAISSGTNTSKSTLQTNKQSYTVYITKTGKKYHRAGCRYLRKSSIAIDKNKAVSEGYTPCSVCNP